MKFSWKHVVVSLVAIVISVAVIGSIVYAFGHKTAAQQVAYKTLEEQSDVYVRFVMEGFDTIIQNYWASTTDADLAGFFQQSLQKAENSPTLPTLPTDDRSGAAKMFEAAFAQATSSEARKDLAINTLVVATYNLPPVGHGELLSATQETAFRDNISNVNPSKDLYQDLGLSDGASSQAVQQAYDQKAKELASATTSEAKAELAQDTYAQKVLANPNTKDLYDQAKVEPSVTPKIIGKTLYIDMSKITPTTFIEFGRAVDSASTTPLDSMVIDLRGNLGGALDFAGEFLGLFIGQNQYIYDLFHQGDYNPQRTTEPYFPELARFKEIAVLTDSMTQSTAEVTTAAMKRLKLATVVGDTTRGWGTVENTFPLTTTVDASSTYSLLLVHSLTLREDEQPIQGNGVVPDVSIADKDWKAELSSHFSQSDIISALEQVAPNPPIQLAPPTQ